MILEKKRRRMVKCVKLDLKRAIAFGLRNKANADGVGRGLRKKRLSDRVLEEYRGKVDKLVLFTAGLKEEFITKDVFTLYIGASEDQTGGGTSTANGVRCALAFLQENSPEDALLKPGVSPWGRDKDVMDMCKGYKYQGKKKNPNKKIRGVMTRPMLDEFVAWMEKKRPNAAKNTGAIALSRATHAIGLRISEALRVLVGDVIDDDYGTKTLLVRADKRVNADTARMEELYAKPLTDEGAAILAKAMVGKLHGEAVFGDLRGKATQEKYRQLYKDAALELKWPSGLEYDGPHVNRHGAMSEMRVKVGEAISDVVLQVVKGTRKTYQKTTQQRKKHGV